MQSPTRFTIRTATPADTETIAQYNIALCQETENRLLNHDTVLKGVARFVTESKRGRYFVAEYDGTIIGQTAYTYEWSDWRNGELWWIQSVYVHRDQRGKGVLRALLSHVKELGHADPDCCGIRLYMERDNHTARQSYLKVGFTETGYEVFERLL